MVSFIRKRFQVFVSSTYRDLIKERQAAVEAILTAGHIPAGMELFTAGDESQMEVIKQWVDESDVYLLILGGRYGSIEPRTGKSYTQIEYEYALDKGMPLFACVITESALDNRIRTHGREAIEDENPQKLKEFRALILTKIVKFWEDYKDIKISIGETLSHLARRDDLMGWVRAVQEANMPALADEIARLSKENAQLRSQVEVNKAEATFNGLSFSELKAIVEKKNLLDFLEENCIELSMGSFALNYDSGNEVSELVSLGVLNITASSNIDGYRSFQFTDAGRAFLNKLKYQKIAEG